MPISYEFPRPLTFLQPALWRFTLFRNPLTDVIVVLVVVLLIFGPKRLPLLGRSLGQGMREFKDSITGKDEEERPALSPGEATEAAAAPPAERPTVTDSAGTGTQARDTADVASSEPRS